MEATVILLTIASAFLVSASGWAAQFFVSNSIQASLSGVLGVRTALAGNSEWTIALQFLILFLTADLMQYVQHYLFHKIPLFWRLHRAHHSAEVLTPVARWRFHPLETVIEAIITGPGNGHRNVRRRRNEAGIAGDVLLSSFPRLDLLRHGPEPLFLQPMHASDPSQRFAAASRQEPGVASLGMELPETPIRMFPHC